jgi:hypothetical protein
MKIGDDKWDWVGIATCLYSQVWQVKADPLWKPLDDKSLSALQKSEELALLVRFVLEPIQDKQKKYMLDQGCGFKSLQDLLMSWHGEPVPVSCRVHPMFTLLLQAQARLVISCMYCCRLELQIPKVICREL